MKQLTHIGVAIEAIENPTARNFAATFLDKWVSSVGSNRASQEKASEKLRRAATLLHHAIKLAKANGLVGEGHDVVIMASLLHAMGIDTRSLCSQISSEAGGNTPLWVELVAETESATCCDRPFPMGYSQHELVFLLAVVLAEGKEAHYLATRKLP